MSKMKPDPFVIHYLNKFLDKKDVVLDVGCGPAIYKDHIKAKYIGLDITDSDYSEGIRRRVDIVSSATEIPLENESIDLVYSKSTIYQIPEYTKALQEFHRVLKPSGRLILFDYNRRTQKRLEKGEGSTRPCWTQWGLMDIVEQAGFRDCELLLPNTKSINRTVKQILLWYEEVFRTWAIVTGVK